jgi:hypothetical protein
MLVVCATSTSAQQQQPPPAEEGARVALILLPGASLKLSTARNYRFWGPSLGLQFDVVTAPQPWSIAVRVALHVGGDGYPDGVSQHMGTLLIGPDVGYELRSGQWALRPSVGIGYMNQLAADEYGYNLETAYVSPAIAGWWLLDDVLLGIEARPVFGFSSRSQDGLALSALVGFRL